MSLQPSLEVLGCLAEKSAESSLPLYSKLTRVLRVAIDDHFEDGQRFWPENMLIQHLGVSQQTVRRALGDLAEEGVLERRVAKGSFVRKTPLIKAQIGALIAQKSFEPSYDCMEHLSYACRESNYRLLTYHTHQGESASDILSQVASIRSLERFVLLGNPLNTTSDLWETLTRQGKKVVCLDTPPGAHKGNYIGVDNAKGIELAMQLLKDLGHERITFLANEPGEQPSIIARQKAFLDFAKRFGMPNVNVASCQTRPWEDAGKAVLRVMPQIWKQRPTALIVASDIGAWNAMAWLTGQGISIPQQISVIGFDNLHASQFTHPTLTSISQPYEQIAQSVLEIINNDPDQSQRLLLAPELMQRASTGPAPR